MQDQHKNILSSYYKDKTEKAVNHLKRSYSLIDCGINEDDVPLAIQSDKQYNKFYKIKINRLSKVFTLILAFPESFPDTFPKLYLSKKDYQEIYPIPHIDKNRFICTKDSNVVSLSDKKPGEAAEELIEIAAEIIERGIKGENKEDFIKEFLAYWDDESNDTLLSLFYPLKDCKQLYLFKLSKIFFNCRFILSESKEKLVKWLIPFDIKIDNGISKVLYIPLSEFNPFSLKENKDLLEILKNSPNRKYIEIVEKYFNDDINNCIIISSFFLDSKRILFGWQHKRLRLEQFKGFRKNHIPLNIRLTDSKTKNLPIEKIRIVRLDKERIFKRGGTIINFLKKDTNITLLGCGSLGSFLAMSLSRCGISNLVLIDNEILSPENTPRHLCGFSEASQQMKKVDAVKKRLTEHFPYLDCQVHNSDFLQLLKEKKISFAKCDLLIVAIGNLALERRINFLQRKGEINCPIIYLWIEPFGVGGHVLYIHPDNDGCYECCFDINGNFLYSIARSEETFQKRESGCQSTFLPYSSLHSEQFISIACKSIIKILEKELNKSMLFTWIGDIEEFESLNFRINSDYDARSSFSIVERRILPNKLCNICVKKGQNI